MSERDAFADCLNKQPADFIYVMCPVCSEMHNVEIFAWTSVNDLALGYRCPKMHEKTLTTIIRCGIKKQTFDNAARETMK